MNAPPVRPGEVLVSSQAAFFAARFVLALPRLTCASRKFISMARVPLLRYGPFEVKARDYTRPLAWA